MHSETEIDTQTQATLETPPVDGSAVEPIPPTLADTPVETLSGDAPVPDDHEPLVVSDVEPLAASEVEPSVVSEVEPAPASPDERHPHEEPDRVLETHHPAHWEVVAARICGVEGGITVVAELPGGKHGVLPASAFEKVPRIGTRVEVAVEPQTADDKGRATLHIAEEDEKLTWRKLELGMRVDAMVTGMNVGGLELKIAGSKIRAFMPKSQIDLTPEPDPTKFLSRKLHCKVLSLEKRRRRVVLSHRMILEKEHRKQRLKEIRAGEVLTGTVRKLETFGVFVQLEPGLDGLVRMGDLAWHRFEDPASVVEVGQEVKVRVLMIDRGRLLLGIRQATPNPWDEAAKKYPPGTKVRGKVTRTTDFGAFVEIEPGVEGLIHISQVSERRVESVEQAVREGQFVDSKVVEIDPRKQRLSLSIKALSQREFTGRALEASRDEIRKYTKSADKAKAVESLMATFNNPSGLKGGIG